MSASTFALVLSALLLAPVCAQAADGGATATAGGVSATIGAPYVDGAAAAPQLTITRKGVVAFARTVPAVVCSPGCTPGEPVVRDLDGDGEPEVVLTASTGGEHCCETLGVYDYRPATGSYGELVQDTRSAGVALEDLDHDGRVELVTRDVRFEDRFSTHPTSFPPPAVFHLVRLDGTALQDVTRRFPAVVRANAARARRELRRFARGDVGAGGLVSAIVADAYLLGEGRSGRRELDRQIARGVLGSRAAARAFRTRLLRLLRTYGYR